jgi:hypothetical protein
MAVKPTAFKNYGSIGHLQGSRLAPGDHSLDGGIDPPSEPLACKYPESRGVVRKCPDCGAGHDLVVHDTRTGEVLAEIEKCQDCLFAGCSINQIQEQIVINE